MCHPLFKELREDQLLLPNGNCLPDLFNFSEREIAMLPSKEMVEVLVPEWYDPVKTPQKHQVTKAQMKVYQDLFKKSGMSSN